MMAIPVELPTKLVLVMRSGRFANCRELISLSKPQSSYTKQKSSSILNTSFSRILEGKHNFLSIVFTQKFLRKAEI